MTDQPTVRVTPLEGHHALRMDWDRDPTDADVRAACARLVVCLNDAETMLHVLVDLTARPTIPFNTTTNCMVMGPQVHPRMGCWLLIGDSDEMQAVITVLEAVSNRRNFRWFPRETAAMAYLSALEEGLAAPDRA
ncbi:MAG: hypothetical protein Kow00124_18390 [Anaerolineae bacterium]